MSAKGAVFLDRDGTINYEVNYLHRPEDVQLIEGAGPAIARLNSMGVPVIVVTNQAGVARGYYDENDVAKVNIRIQQMLKDFNAHVDAFYFCPHHPTIGRDGYRKDCRCRKPQPGMLTGAAKDLGVRLKSSFMTGDKLIDMEAGSNAGCRTILVLSGYGRQEAERITPCNLLAVPDYIAETLEDAVDWIASWTSSTPVLPEP